MRIVSPTAPGRGEAMNAAAAGLVAVLQPIRLSDEADFRLGGLRVRPSRLEVVQQGRSRQVEPRVMQVLVALARADGDVVSRDALIALCWRGRFVSDDAITRCIVSLRRLARAYPSAFRIHTIRRVGYRLTEGDAPSAAGAPMSPLAAMRLALSAAGSLLRLARQR